MANEVNTEKIAQRLRHARGMEKRRQVCEAIGVSLSALSMWETGRRLPGADAMAKLANHYRTSVQALFFDA